MNFLLQLISIINSGLVELASATFRVSKKNLTINIYKTIMIMTDDRHWKVLS